MPVIGVLALQGDVREHVHALEESGASARPVRRLQEIESVDGLVIPGGESTTLWRLATAFDLLDPIRKLIAGGMPAGVVESFEIIHVHHNDADGSLFSRGSQQFAFQGCFHITPVE